MTLSFPMLGSGWCTLDLDGSVRACVRKFEARRRSEVKREERAKVKGDPGEGSPAQLPCSSRVSHSGAFHCGGTVSRLPPGVLLQRHAVWRDPVGKGQGISPKAAEVTTPGERGDEAAGVRRRMRGGGGSGLRNGCRPSVRHSGEIN